MDEDSTQQPDRPGRRPYRLSGMALCAALLVAGCGDSPWAGVTELVAAPAPAPAPASLNGPGLRLAIDGRSRGIAELVQELGERRLWRTPSGLVVATDGARVVATAGLPQVLVATRVDGPDPLVDPQALLDRTAVARRLVDLMRPSRDPASMRFGIAVECRLSAREAPAEQALLVEERCRAGGSQSFVNRFWVDPSSNTIYRSEQWVGVGASLLSVEPVVPEALTVPTAAFSPAN